MLELKKIYNKMPKDKCPDFFKNSAGCQVVVFDMPEDLKTHSTPEDILAEKNFLDIPLPFENQWFESTVPYGIHVSGSDVNRILLRGFLIKELAPENLLIYMILDFKQGEEVYVDGMMKINLTRETILNEHEKVGLAILQTFLIALNDSPEYGTTDEHFVLKKGVGKDSYRHEIKQIIHIRKKIRKCESSQYNGKVVDWSHRWRVRGHWRKLQGVGKDRHGEYAIKGFTWVKDFVKGNENLPLIEKTRVLHGV